MNKVLCLAVIIIFYAQETAPAQPLDSTSSQFSIGLSGHYGFIFAHSREVQNTQGARPFGVTVSAIWKLTGLKTWQTCACMPRMGSYVSFYDYDVALLGRGVIASYFLEPDFKITPNLYANIRGSFGTAFLTHPYHVTDNPTNMSYSTIFNFYGAVSAGFRFLVHPSWSVNIMAEYKHISNGGIKTPNKGINWPVATLGIEYTPKPQIMPEYLSVNKAVDKTIKYTIMAYNGSKNIEVNDPRRYFIWGITGYATKPIGRINALNAGVELMENFANKERLRRAGDNTASQAVALLTGHEFLLGKFTFTQQIGWYLYDPTPFYPMIFHRWGFNYHPYKAVVIGINLKAHYQVADFFDIRIGVRIPNKKL